ncbi:nuclear mRNA export, poly(A)+RNA binding protein [Podila humilis]|nr:nuclear mRNA export, poly(A)+RNA binding protein [Podila humilis]
MQRSGGRPSRGRSGGRGGERGEQLDNGVDTRGPVTELFTSGGRDRMASSGGPTRSKQTARRGARRGAASLPPRPHVGEDIDGDMKMGGDNSKTFNPYQRPGRSSRTSAPQRSPANGGVLIFKSSNQSTGMVSFMVDDIAQAKAVRGLSGIRYNSMKLIIKTTAEEQIMGDGARSATVRMAQTPGTIDSIRAFIRSRCQGQFLDLENMASDSILRNAGVIPPGPSTARSDVGAVLMKVASQLFPDITTISFASNGLRSLAPISSVAQYFPNIQNLSFKNNNIRSYRDLEALSGAKKLPHLREIILLDNPVRDIDISRNKDDISYKSEITKLFPSIQFLDQQSVGPKISFGLGDIADHTTSKTSTLPAPIRGNFFDSPDTQAMVLEFLTNYFKLFDTNRSLLEHMYDSSATFSVCTNVTIPPVQKAKGMGGDNWAEYTNSARNLSRLKNLSDRTTRLQVGNKDIVREGLIPLPKTTHDLSDPSKFCIDAWQTGGLLPAVCIYIMVHGEFAQGRSPNGREYTKSFDRSFIIAPAPPTSSAAQHGWKCLIISDQLIVRQHSGHDAWKPEPELSTTVASAATSAFNAASGGTTASTNQAAPVSAATPQQPGVGPDPNQVPMQGSTFD